MKFLKCCICQIIRDTLTFKIFFTVTKCYKKKKSNSSICKQTGQYHQDKNENIE